MDESACVPHRYHGTSDTFLHSLSIMYLFVSNLLLNIYMTLSCEGGEYIILQLIGLDGESC